MRSASETSDAPVVRLWIGGDVNLGTANNPVLKPLVDVLKGAGGIVNLEGPVAQKVPSGKKLRLVNAPEALSQLRDVGVRVAGIANNHALDRARTVRGKQCKHCAGQASFLPEGQRDRRSSPLTGFA
jgi:Bacterial capsule synthesis protein PGA_cap